MPRESFVMGDFTDLSGHVEAEGIKFEVWDGGRAIRFVFADGSSWVGDGPLVQVAVTPDAQISEYPDPTNPPCSVHCSPDRRSCDDCGVWPRREAA